MKVITTNVYLFDELNESGKQHAIDSNYYINVEHFDWWGNQYEDAEQQGIKIKGFDLDRVNSITIEFEESERNTAELITANWGEVCEGVTECKKFLKDYDILVDAYQGPEATEENEQTFFEKSEMLEDDFKMTLERVFLNLLKAEYEYLTSKEAIIKTFESNDYHFTSDGIMKNS